MQREECAFDSLQKPMRPNLVPRFREAFPTPESRTIVNGIQRWRGQGNKWLSDDYKLDTTFLNYNGRRGGRKLRRLFYNTLLYVLALTGLCGL